MSEGSAAAGVRPIEAVTGRGAYDLIARRFKMLKQTAAALKSSIEDVPFKVESLQDEVSDLKKELAALRTQLALSSFNAQLANVQSVKDVNLLAIEVLGANMDTLRSLADKFRKALPDTDDPSVLDEFCRIYQHMVGMRLTLIRKDGKVMGESERKSLELEKHMERRK